MILPFNFELGLCIRNNVPMPSSLATECTFQVNVMFLALIYRKFFSLGAFIHALLLRAYTYLSVS